ncbi:MAG: hypothetical protein H2172_07800 [Opitutus sp.]|nr:hypothetical protein [Opitutus sp.]MCS6245936.1 hypothetical protein [Opitutus sp.]MCS6272924.1 hypothetical protein [Opitutus sp.]MCS6275983.1 hypothetical protein [Opitutus sp.]MCS6301078.1 hypothetical protein [Opitutus sp.]
MHASLIGCYARALREPAVWKRAARLGVAVGLVQVALNQGDHWAQGHITRLVVVKSASSLLFAILVVLLASASTRVDTLRSTPPL